MPTPTPQLSFVHDTLSGEQPVDSTDDCGEPRLFWYASAGEGLPGWCRGAGIEQLEWLAESNSVPFICFVPVNVRSLGREIAEFRERLGRQAYMIIVPDTALSPAWAVRAIDLGADDLMDVEASVDIVIARAKRAMAARSHHAATLAQVEADRAFLQKGIDTLPSPIFYKNRKGTYIGCNKAFEEFIGLSRDQVVGSSVYDVAPAHLAKIYEDADEKLMCERGVQIYEANVRYADGSEHTVSFHKAAMIDEQGEVIGLAGAMLDITDRKTLEAQLVNAAERDPLTNCFNRRKFFKAGSALIDAARRKTAPLCVLVVDIDHFKSVNDRFGHAGGDIVLKEIAERLEGYLRADDLMARAGGEEFFFVCADMNVDEAVEHAETLRTLVAEHTVGVEGENVAVTISVGVAELRSRHENLNEVLKRADRALYEAKTSGRNRVHRYGSLAA